MAQNGLHRLATDATTTLPTSPDTDDIYRLLADDERRVLLGTLHEEGCVTVDSLREQLTADPDDDHHANIRLYHIHLPKLAEAGLVAHDTDAELVTPTIRGRELAAHIGC